jgi:endogenous inhibitor of DNA gyrase (YacG/DUF329 family)
MTDFVPTEYKGSCPTCRQPFISNHLNRRYCSSACKIWANNHKARTKRASTNDINGILAKNQNILRGYAHKQIVKINVLMQKGFNFGYRTHQANFENIVSVICYDVGYQYVTEDKTLVKIILT